MEYLVCSIRDEVSENFGNLNLEVSEASAIRNFQVAIAQANEEKKGLLYFNGADFALYRLGRFDSTTGDFTSDVPRVLFRGGRADE